MSNFESIFIKGSKTFYNATKFFPKKTREDITRLYAFVRKADDYVDCVPQQKDEFFNFKNTYYQALKDFEDETGNKSKNKSKIEDYHSTNLTEDEQIIYSFLQLQKEYNFEKSWTDAFLKSMQMDLEGGIYYTEQDTMEYIYGAASVIGLYICKILNLPKKSFNGAMFLGQSFQYINFIRDIDEDNKLGRLYFSKELLSKFNLTNLEEQTTKNQPEDFENFINYTLNQYYDWYKKAELDFINIPYKYRVAIKTASQMYDYTGKIISKNPFIVYQKKVKPSRLKIALAGIKNLIFG